MSLTHLQRLEQYDAYPLPLAETYYDTEFNCRGEFTLESVRDLAESISQNGLQFPVVVQPVEDSDREIPAGYKWRLIAGHRRFQAVRVYLRWPTIPASVRRGLTYHQARVLNLTENLERKDLNPLEEAFALGRLYPDGVALRVAAKELKRDQKWIQTRFRILKLPEHLQQLVAARRITLLDIEIIFQQPEGQRVKAAEAIAEAKRGRGQKPRFTGQRFVRSFKRRKNKAEINEFITRLINLGIDGFASRAAAWCAGYVSDAEINEDIEHECATRGVPGRISSDAESTEHAEDAGTDARRVEG